MTDEDSENGLDDNDVAMVQAIRRYAEEQELDGLTAEKMLMCHFGVNPEDVVLIEDDDSWTG